ncbi:hypothetical protein, partial [Dialister invisus]|uniref:hypothetical protein n=1 Tax=Dialister invisus TaxID=218538 RepID=UPI00399EFF69
PSGAYDQAICLTYLIIRAVIKMLYEKKVNGNMKRSEESIMPVTAYGFPHHGNRSFTFVQDDAFRSPSS